MYVGRGRGTYYVGTEQHASRAPFLILASSDKKDANGYCTLYGIVRKVALAQCGHFMMGTARIAGTSITVSGPFGGDGLPKDYDNLPEKVQALFTLVPSDLAQQYWTDNPRANANLRGWAQTINS